MATLSAPTLTELLTEARTVLGQLDATNSNWPDLELTQYANDAVRRYFKEIIANAEGQFDKVTTLNLTAGTETVALPSDFFEIRTLKKVDNQDKVILFYRNKFDESHRINGQSTSSLYRPYYYFRGDSIVLRPIPDFSETGGLELEYTAFPETLVSGGDSLTSGISAVFRDVIIWHIIYTAKLAESVRGGGINTYGPSLQALNDKVGIFKATVRERSYSPTAIKPFDENEFD